MNKKLIIIPVLMMAFFAVGTAVFTTQTEQVSAWAGGDGGPGGCCGAGEGGDIDPTPTPEPPGVTPGCTDATANNYNPSADADDGSCEYDPVPTCDFFNITQTQVSPGATINLDWGTTDVANASINQGVGSVTVDGLRTENAPTTPGTYEYVLTFDGNTSNDCRDTVTVVADQPEISCDDLSFTASDTLVTPGTDVALEWVFTGDVLSASVNQGIGAVNSGDTEVVTIDSQITYTTTITGSSNSVQCPLTINTEQVTPICEGVSFGASDTSVDEGDNITLDWSWTQTYDEVRITNGVGVVNNNDSVNVSIDNDEQFAIEVTRGNETETCTSININADTDNGGGGGGGGTPYPRCEEFEASDETITAGERVTLSWETRFTREVTLFEGDEDDEELFYTDDDDTVDDGEFVVRPSEDTTYTLLLERGSRDRTCDIDIEVEDNVIVLTDREQEPRVAGIALTQVPYTGFEAGPVLTIFFYLLLALWGLFVAYTFVIKSDSILGFSLPGAFPRNQSVTDVSTDATDAEEDSSEAAAYVATATTAAPANLPTGNAPAVTLGYAATAAAVRNEDDEDVITEADDTLTDLENRAHAQHALLSSDALRYFAGSYSSEEQFEALDDIIKDAKQNYPSEDGWVVINLERLQQLMDVTDVVADLGTTPTTSGSLAEAIASGNAAAALTLIGDRPMVVLADAATDFDTLYRMRNGGDDTVSDLLASATSHLTDSQITDVLHALNSAMDGTYTDEGDAVKTAVLKAIAVVS